MLTVHLLASDSRRNNAGGFQYNGLQRPLQMLTQIARLPREERLRRSPLRCRKVSEKGKVFIRQRNNDRAHAVMMPCPRTAAKLVREFVWSSAFRRAGTA